MKHFVGDYDFDLATAVQSVGREVCFIPYSDFEGTEDGYYRSLVTALDDHIDFLLRHHEIEADVKFALTYVPKKGHRASFSEIGYPYVVIAKNGTFYIVIQDEHIRLLRSYALHMTSTQEASHILQIPFSETFGSIDKFTDRRAAIDAEPKGTIDHAVFVADSNLVTSPENLAVGTLFWISSVKALLSHEFAHIRNGHISLKASRGGVAFDQDIQHALEHDADAFACRMTFGDIGSQIGSVRKVEESLPGFTVRDVQHVALLSASTMYLVHRYFHGEYKDDFEKSSHPISLSRALMGALYFEGSLSSFDHKMSSEDYGSKIYHPAITLCESALKRAMPGYSYTKEMFLAGFALIDYQQSVFDSGWNKIRDDLVPFWLGKGGPAEKH